MKIDRRSFIALGVGVVAGSTLTPVPWKLTDDISIWTQNWPWTPMPKDGGDSYKTSVCTLCPGGCGIQVRRVIDRAVKIDGLAAHPLNQGKLCPLGLSGLQFLYGPARVRSPLKRTGKRGEGKWQQVSWDEAIQDIAAKLTELRKNGKPQSLAWIADTDRGTVPQLIQRFMDAYGSPNFIRTPSSHDAFEMAASLMQGRQGTVGFDIEGADHVISFGSALFHGWGAPVHMLNIHGRMHDKKTIVQVEPRLSDTAAKADRWVAVKPGTEGALALGIAHVIVKESLYDRSFVEQSCFGFEDWTDADGNRHKGFKSHVLEDYQPAIVSQITGVSAGTIAELARGFARAKRPVAVGGRGEGQIPGALNEAMAVLALNALAGSIGQPGGVRVMPEQAHAKWPEVKYDRTASRGLQQPRIDGAGSEKYPDARYLLHRLPEAISGAEGDSPVQALFAANANPLYTLPDTAGAKAAFDRIPLLVSFSPYMDETAAYSDYILPNHTYLERYEDVPPPAGTTSRIVGLCRPVVRPLYDTRHTGDVVIQLAGAVGDFVKNAFPWKNYQAFLKTVFQDQWDELTKKGFAVLGPEKSGSRAGEFNTPSGRFEFTATGMEGAARPDPAMLPGFSEIAMEGPADEYPLLLIAYDSMRITSGATGSPPFMTKTIDADVLKNQTNFVEINPQTARKLGFFDGNRVLVATPRGKAQVRLKFFEGIEPGVIAMPRGLGHSAYSKYLAGKGANFNSLIGPVDDAVSGLNTAWGIRANITRA
jgi:anaerobic selenocysteine-containing dehydrogenase